MPVSPDHQQNFLARIRLLRRYTVRISLVGLLVLAIHPQMAFAQETPPQETPQQQIEFNRDIRPLLSEYCFQCHGPDQQARQAGLRLDQRAGATALLESGLHAISPGEEQKSELLSRVTAKDADLRMPPAETGKKLSPEQIVLLRQWIKSGSPWQEHWSLISPVKPQLPKSVEGNHWIRNPIDAFVLARLQREKLLPAAEASKAALLRRVSLDLTGLPPTPEELDAFLADDSPAAYEKVVDRLLASPHYGERMALPWLDAARYADTNGYNNDEPRAMWPWRDWVIQAFNDNLPYDQFVTHQIAGDLLPNATRDQQLATAFNRNHVLTTEGGIIEEEYRVEYVADRVHTTATVFLGLSMGCARCHDHKYDPITQKEYYAFFAFFNQLPHHPAGYNRDKAAPPVLEIPSAQQKSEHEKLAADLEQAKAETPPNAERVKKLEAELAALDKAIPQVMVMQDLPEPRKTHLLVRGEYDKPQEVVPPDTPASLFNFPDEAPRNRLGLASWLVDPQHPLTARVAVNRWWSQYFGLGLVKTVEDFGSQGDWPSHPELLDWLATELVESKWDIKAMQRLIVTSATYRQSSDVPAERYAKDPENRLLARASRFRLSGELIRDQALAISGLLVPTVGGPSVMPYQPAGLWEDVSVERKYKYTPDTGPGLYRRGMYTFWKRTSPPPAMTTFDAPDRESCVARRARTNTPLQALVLLNDPSFVEAARLLGEKMLLNGGRTPAEQIRFGVKCVLARSATEQEEQILLQIHVAALARFQGNEGAALELLKIGNTPRNEKINPAEAAAMTTVANVLLNLDETLTRK